MTSTTYHSLLDFLKQILSCLSNNETDTLSIICGRLKHLVGLAIECYFICIHESSDILNLYLFRPAFVIIFDNMNIVRYKCV